MDMSTAQRCKLSSFLARPASVSTCGNAFGGFARTAFRKALETLGRVISSALGVELPIREVLLMLNSRLLYAPHKLISQTRKLFRDSEHDEMWSI